MHQNEKKTKDPVRLKRSMKILHGFNIHLGNSMVCFWIISVGLYSSFWFGCRARHDIDQPRTIQGGSLSSMKWNNDASVKHKLPFFPTSLHIFSYDQKLFGLEFKI